MAAILDFEHWGHKLLIGRIWECFHSISRPRKLYICQQNFDSSCFGSEVIKKRKIMAAILDFGHWSHN